MAVAVAMARERASVAASNSPNIGPTWAPVKKVSAAMPNFQPASPIDSRSSRSESPIRAMKLAGAQTSQRESDRARALVISPPLTAPMIPAGPRIAPV